MMTAIPATPDNRVLAAAVNGRIRADGVMLAARAAAWRLGAIGLLALLTGAGVGAACYGYSYVQDTRTSAQKMATAFADALDHANLGRVRLDTGGASVKLDTGDAAVKLAPDATVRLDPQAHVNVTLAANDPPRPSPQQLQQQSSGGKTVTNYTIFKTVELAGNSGEVQTGWNFESSEQQHPSSQFCHYRRALDDGDSEFVMLAQDGRLIPNNLAQRFALDPEAVATHCVWFGS